MTTSLVDMLAAARRAGLVLVHNADGQLVIRGPRCEEPLVRQLLARKAEVLTTLSVYNGAASRLDWRKGQILDQPQPCILCAKRTLLIEPYDDQPCHKTCAEAAIRWGTTPPSSSRCLKPRRGGPVSLEPKRTEGDLMAEGQKAAGQ